MKVFQLNIANYIISAESTGPDLTLAPKFQKFINKGFAGPGSLTITLHSGSTQLPSSAKCVFQAPYVEETGGNLVQKDAQFWSVWKNGDELFLKVKFPGETDRHALLRFSPDSLKWDLMVDSGRSVVDPLEYPLDGLILYYLSVINGDILIHASGINHSGKGYIFSGVSGKGKSTMAGLWKSAGATVIHDDRMIIRNVHGTFMMYNTPIYEDEEPSSSAIDSIFLIEHGPENIMTRVSGATAMSMMLSNCIQHNWNPGMIAGLLSSVSGLCNKIPVYRLAFRPDHSITDYILKNG
jgi:hypothetical protein